MYWETHLDEPMARKCVARIWWYILRSGHYCTNWHLVRVKLSGCGNNDRLQHYSLDLLSRTYSGRFLPELKWNTAPKRSVDFNAMTTFILCHREINDFIAFLTCYSTTTIVTRNSGFFLFRNTNHHNRSTLLTPPPCSLRPFSAVSSYIGFLATLTFVLFSYVHINLPELSVCAIWSQEG